MRMLMGLASVYPNICLSGYYNGNNYSNFNELIIGFK